MLSKLGGAAEHTAWFAFFLVIFMAGAMMAIRFVGYIVRPVTDSLGSALEAA